MYTIYANAEGFLMIHILNVCKNAILMYLIPILVRVNFIYDGIVCSKILLFYTINPYFFTTFSKFLSLLFPYFFVEGYLLESLLKSQYSLAKVINTCIKTLICECGVQRLSNQLEIIGNLTIMTFTRGTGLCKILYLQYRFNALRQEVD